MGKEGLQEGGYAQRHLESHRSPPNSAAAPADTPCAATADSEAAAGDVAQQKSTGEQAQKHVLLLAQLLHSVQQQASAHEASSTAALAALAQQLQHLRQQQEQQANQQQAGLQALADRLTQLEQKQQVQKQEQQLEQQQQQGEQCAQEQEKQQEQQQLVEQMLQAALDQHQQQVATQVAALQETMQQQLLDQQQQLLREHRAQVEHLQQQLQEHQQEQQQQQASTQQQQLQLQEQLRQLQEELTHLREQQDRSDRGAGVTVVPAVVDAVHADAAAETRSALDASVQQQQQQQEQVQQLQQQLEQQQAAQADAIQQLQGGLMELTQQVAAWQQQAQQQQLSPADSLEAITAAAAAAQPPSTASATTTSSAAPAVCCGCDEVQLERRLLKALRAEAQAAQHLLELRVNAHRAQLTEDLVLLRQSVSRQLRQLTSSLELALDGLMGCSDNSNGGSGGSGNSNSGNSNKRKNSTIAAVRGAGGVAQVPAVLPQKTASAAARGLVAAARGVSCTDTVDADGGSSRALNDAELDVVLQLLGSLRRGNASTGTGPTSLSAARSTDTADPCWALDDVGSLG